MANIKISELNELTQATRSNNDYVPIVDTSANETKKITVESLIPSNVTLLAVTDIEPATCYTGDQYFNTTTNLIYTAIETNVWGATGVQAQLGITYIVFGTQSAYAYNGTTLVSVGGGSGSSSIVNTYSTSTTEAYSCEYENEHFGGVVLYSDSTGIASGTIPLSDSIQNYSYIEVYGCATLDQANCYAKIPKERYDKRGNLFEFNADGNLYVKLVIFEFSNNTTINIRKNISWWKPSSSGNGGYNANENEIKIFKVVGYK